MEENNLPKNEKSEVSATATGNASAQEQRTEKPKLVRLPMEESLFEFDGFEFEEVGKNPPRSKDELENDLKKDEMLVKRLSELHGLNKNENSEKSEDEEEKEGSEVTEESSDPETAEEIKQDQEPQQDQKEDKNVIAAQIAASFTGKNDDIDSRQVTFLDVINDEDDAADSEEEVSISEYDVNVVAEMSAKDQSEVKEDTVANAEPQSAESQEPETEQVSETESQTEQTEAIEENSQEAEAVADVIEITENSGNVEGQSEVSEEAEAETEQPQADKKPFDMPDREDVWDEEDREMMQAKKRYMDYCRSLVVPPLKITKEISSTRKEIQKSEPRSSGYKYEMIERLPLYADGIDGGKESQGYKDREMAYCAQREEKRSAELGGKARSYYKRVIFAAVLFAIGLIFESMNIFMGKAPDLLLTKDNLIVFVSIEIALLLIGAIIAIDSIFAGLKSMFKGAFIPETLAAGLILAAIAYHASLLLYPTFSGYTVLLGTPAFLSVLLTSLYKYYMTQRELTAFGVTSSYGDYTTEVKIQGFEATPEGNAFKGYAAKNTMLYKLNKVSRIDGCYRNRSTGDECFGVLRKVALGTVIVSVLCGVIFGLLKSSVCYGVLSAYVMILLSSPIGVFVSMYLPRIRCAKAASEMGAAFIGFDECTNDFEKSVIMLDDGDIFPAEKLKIVEFVVSRTEAMEMQLSRICGLYSLLGGPVAQIFKNMKPGLIPCGKVSFDEIDERGITARIDGKVLVCGCETYLEKYGIEVERYDGLMAENARAMYIAEDGEFIARIIMEFGVDEELCQRISELRHTETLFSLKTANPCIDTELVFELTGIEPDLLKVIKYNALDDITPANTDREGTLVSKTGPKGLIAAMLEYKRQKRLVFAGSKLAGASAIIGGVAGLILVGMGANFGFLSLMCAFISVVMVLFSVFTASRSAINTKSKKKKK